MIELKIGESYKDEHNLEIIVDRIGDIFVWAKYKTGGYMFRGVGFAKNNWKLLDKTEK